MRVCTSSRGSTDGAVPATTASVNVTHSVAVAVVVHVVAVAVVAALMGREAAAADVDGLVSTSFPVTGVLGAAEEDDEEAVVVEVVAVVV